jgi:hypothetical protein
MAIAKLPIIAPAGVSLCETCAYASTIKGHAERQQIVICTKHFDPVLVPFPVKECSDYVQKAISYPVRAKELAWAIHVAYDGAGEQHALASGKIELNKRNHEDA